jgi:Predicted nucleoside-diphosphate sugar epimerases
MGATKRVAELICQTQNTDESETVFSIVRFGNVLNSSGSVIPKFASQINSGGPITLTHPDMERYFMTIEEAAQLVIQASSIAVNGEVFVLDMGKPIKIFDLAQHMIRLQGYQVGNADTHEMGTGDTIKIEITAPRPGEKLFEELWINQSPIKTIHPKIMKTADDGLSDEGASYSS